VLVFCHDGISRSAAIIIAYLMFFKRKTFSQAFTFLKLKRRQAKPNFGFVKQLIAFEKSLCLDADFGTAKLSEISKYIINND